MVSLSLLYVLIFNLYLTSIQTFIATPMDVIAYQIDFARSKNQTETEKKLLW